MDAAPARCSPTGASGPEPGDRPAVLRLRFLKDGRDFASAAVINAQSGPRIASAVRLVTGFGDWHVSLTVRRITKNSWPSDLRVRYELTARARPPAPWGQRCSNWPAGDGGPCCTSPRKARRGRRGHDWEVGRQLHRRRKPATARQVWLDGMYRHGDKAVLDLSTTKLPMAGIGLELLRRDAPMAETAPILGHNDGRVQWSVAGGIRTAKP